MFEIAVLVMIIVVCSLRLMKKTKEYFDDEDK